MALSSFNTDEDSLRNNASVFQIVGGGFAPIVNETYVTTNNSSGYIFNFDTSSYSQIAKYSNLDLNGTIRAVTNIAADVAQIAAYSTFPESALPATCTAGTPVYVLSASSAVGTCTTGSATTIAICQSGNVWLCL